MENWGSRRAREILEGEKTNVNGGLFRGKLKLSKVI